MKKSARRHPPQAAGIAVTRRRSLLWLGVGVLISVLTVPAASSLLRQMMLMAPPESRDTRIADAVQQALRRDRPSSAAYHACGLLSTPGGSTDLETLQQMDSSNGLYAWLTLLETLRGEPADDAAVLSKIRTAVDAPPARTHLQRRIEVVRQTVQAVRGGEKGAADLEADAWAMWMASAGHPCRPVLRELITRLLDLGRRCREAGRTDDAITVHRATAGLMGDVLEDSPRPEIALLLAESASRLIEELRADAAGTSASADMGGEAEIVRWEELRQRWHDAGKQHGASLLPWTGDVALAPAAQQRALRGMMAAGLVAVGWAVMFAIVVAAVLLSLHPVRPDDLPVRRSPGQRLVAGAIAAAPALIGVVALAAGAFDLKWLISQRTLPVAGLFPVLYLASVGIAARVTTRLPARERTPELPRNAAFALAAIPLVVFVIAALLVPMHTEPWRPPASVQLLRKAGLLATAAVLPVSLAWIAWGFQKRRKAGVRVGVQARSTLAAAAAGFAMLSALWAATLLWAEVRSHNYANAFHAASLDPVADRLGPGWQDEFLAGLRRATGLPTGR